jgi:cytochrome c oxidase subunit 2
VIPRETIRAPALLSRGAGMVCLPELLRKSARKVLIVCGFAVAAVTLGDSRPLAQTTEPRTIEVTARRFAFEPSKIEATVGERLQLVVRSADGVHGLEIKKLKIKKEIPRGGEPVTIDFTATTEGDFPILCSEYCGNGHDDMSGMLVVRSTARTP